MRGTLSSIYLHLPTFAVVIKYILSFCDVPVEFPQCRPLHLHLPPSRRRRSREQFNHGPPIALQDPPPQPREGQYVMVYAYVWLVEQGGTLQTIGGLFFEVCVSPILRLPLLDEQYIS